MKSILTVPFSPCAEHHKTTRNTLTEIQIVFHPVAQRAAQLANGTNNPGIILIKNMSFRTRYEEKSYTCNMTGGRVRRIPVNRKRFLALEMTAGVLGLYIIKLKINTNVKKSRLITCSVLSLCRTP